MILVQLFLQRLSGTLPGKNDLMAESGTVLEISFGIIPCNLLKPYLYLGNKCLIVQHNETFTIQL